MKENNNGKENYFSIFNGLDKLLNVVADMVDHDKDEVNLKGDIKTDRKKTIGKYGFNIMLGPDKNGGLKDITHDFKWKEPTCKPQTVSPVTDVFKEEDRVTIVCELPGVEKEDIELELNDNMVIITASKKDICYSKKVALDFVPSYSSIEESFHNSIYSVILSKACS